MDIPRNWFVITGGPSSGKTSVIEALAARGVVTMPEAGRTVIDDALSRGITLEELRHNNGRNFRRLTIAQNLANMLTVTQLYPPDTPVVFDRGIHDSFAYAQYYKQPLDETTLATLALIDYRRVFLFNSLPTFTQDYARTEEAGFNQTFTPILKAAYMRYGMPVISVPVASVESRANQVIENLG